MNVAAGWRTMVDESESISPVAILMLIDLDAIRPLAAAP